jgi:hypothetical protein
VIDYDLESLKLQLPDRSLLENLQDATDYDKQLPATQDQIIISAQQMWSVIDYADALKALSDFQAVKIYRLTEPERTQESYQQISGTSPKVRGSTRKQADGKDAFG